MNCYKVRVETTNSSNNVTHGNKVAYLECENSILFVICESPSDIEKIVKASSIECIERLGIGYK